MIGGHCVAHSPLQLDLAGFAVSRSKRYSVQPPLSTTTLPMRGRVFAVSEVVLKPTGAAGAAAGGADVAAAAAPYPSPASAP